MFGVVKGGKVVYQTTNYYDAFLKAIDLKDMTGDESVYLDLI